MKKRMLNVKKEKNLTIIDLIFPLTYFDFILFGFGSG